MTVNYRGPRHIIAPGNPRLYLHQEYAMRTGDYDGKATVVVQGLPVLPDGTVPFAEVVEAVGVDAAVRAVRTCWWLSETDVDSMVRLARVEECRECVEVARS